MFLFYNKQYYQNDQNEVFSFFRHAKNVGLWMFGQHRVEILSDPNQIISKGSLIDYSFYFLGRNWRWTTYIDTFENNKSFSEVQLKGPFRYWRHAYHFNEHEQGTVLENNIQYHISFWGFEKHINSLLIKPKLYDYFSTKNKEHAKHLSMPGVSPCLS